MNHYSIKLKVLLILSSLLICSFMGLGLFSYKNSSEILKTKIINEDLPILVQGISSKVNAELLPKTTIADVMANNHFLKIWFDNGESDVQVVKNYIATLIKNYDIFTASVVSAKTNNYYTSKGISKVLKKDDPSSQWFYSFINGELNNKININIDKNNGNRLIAFINFKVKTQTETLGSVSVGLDINSISKIIEKNITNNRNVYIIDKNGYIIIHKNQKMIYNNKKDSKEEALQKNIKSINQISLNQLENKNVIVEREDSHGKKLVAWDYISSLDGYVVIEEYEKGLFYKINEMFNEIIIISLVFTAIVLLLLLFAIDKIVIEQIKILNDGLVNFFDFLNGKSDNAELLLTNSKDEFGQMIALINENINVIKTNTKQEIQFIESVTIMVNKVKLGEIGNKIQFQTNNPALQNLKNTINEMIESFKTSVGIDINDIVKILEEYTNNNYVNSIADNSGKIGLMVNKLGNSITDLLLDNKRNALNLRNNSSILLTNVSTLNSSSTSSATALKETAISLGEVTSSVKSSRNKISEMSNFATEVTNSVKEGENLAIKTTNAMDEINEQVSAINEAITVIDQISFQTNILSLNAAVEAATAGEAGKGFAVVAQEVRNLASRSADAAKTIKEIVKSASEKANEGKVISDKMIEGYANLSNDINKTINIIVLVSKTSEEQTKGLIQISDSINSLDKQTQNNANIANDTQVIANDTEKIVDKILENVESKSFKDGTE